MYHLLILFILPFAFSYDLEFDCAAREYGLRYAITKQPWRSPGDFERVFEALELTSRCNIKFADFARQHLLPVRSDPAEQAIGAKTRKAANTVYVSPQGSNKNPGTKTAPFLTIDYAISVTRKAAGAGTIVLLEGVYYLAATLNLSSQDNHLTVRAEEGHAVRISGGIPLAIQEWKPYNIDHKSRVVAYENQNNILNRLTGPAINSTTIIYLGKFSSRQDCQARCVQFDGRGAYTCHSYTYFAASIATWGAGCYMDIEDVWGPTYQAGVPVTAGRVLRMNVYVADLSKQTNLQSIPGLRFDDKRLWRARYPNSNPETTFFPDGWIQKQLTQKWYPRGSSKAKTVTVKSPNRSDVTAQFQYYTIGLGGPCTLFEPSESYWCSEDNSGGGHSVFGTVSGLTYQPQTFVGRNFSNPIGAHVHAFHWAHWALWMFEVDSYNAATHRLGWTKGGFQGARGAYADTGFMGGSEWFIENVFEALDSANEYFFNESTRMLYYFHNGTDAPPTSPFVATNLKVLVNIVGSQANPVVGVKFHGITFCDTAFTYMEPHGIPSGGDWAMQHIGTITARGTERLHIADCNFTRIDGNAINILGYNRHALIERSEFSWLGENGIVLWGDTKGIDGMDGSQPRHTHIRENVFREVGIVEKQASGVFQAKTCQSNIKGNIFFNGPRALVNFNDGFGGNNTITENFFFNPNRETSDQGPFNSWDRQPFITDIRDGVTPSLIPGYNYIHENYFFCNYGSNMCIDNDDGSAYYKLFNNFEVYGGHKSDFGGHDKVTYGSINAYSQVYQNGLCGGFNPNWYPGHTDGYYNNTCIQVPAGLPYMYIPNCNITNMQKDLLPVLHDNVIMNSNPTQSLLIICGNSTVTEADFKRLGLDPGTRTAPIPTTNQIISMARKLLHF